MNTNKAHRLWLAVLITSVVLISVTGAVMKEDVVQNEYVVTPSGALQTNETASALRSPTAPGVPSFSSLGIKEFTSTLVKGAPVSATVVMQHEQTASDGNGTTRTASGKVYRDSQGRTRHDEMGETKGPDGSVVEDLLKTTINDPAAGVSFIIDPKANIARRKTFFAQPEPGSDEARNATAAPVKQGPRNSQILAVPGTMDMGQGFKSANTTSSSNVKREPLGRRQIEGMVTDGARIVMTVAASKPNNEKPIEIGCERWYSPSLKTLVFVECSDSRYGKSSYRLTQIKIEEPAASLFKIPSDYKIYE